MHSSTQFHTDTTLASISKFFSPNSGGTGWVVEAGFAQEPLESFCRGRVPSIAGQLYAEFLQSDGCSPLVIEGLACELAGWSARDLRPEPAAAPWVFQVRDLLRDSFQASLQAAARSIQYGFGAYPVFAREGGSNPILSTFDEVLQRPVIMFGLGSPEDSPHSANESLSLRNFHRGTIAVARLFDEIAEGRFCEYNSMDAQ